MHWVQSKQTSGESWAFKQTVGFVRNSHGNGEWGCDDAEILGALKKSRAVKVNGRYSSVENTPKEFVELLCGGARHIGQDIRKELAISGFVLPKYASEQEFQGLNRTNDDLHYKVVSFEGETSELGVADGLPHEPQHNQAIFSVLTELGYKPFAPQSSSEGDGKPDVMVNISEETFVMEGTKSTINDHLKRFETLEMYKKAKHKGLYIIGNDNERMEKTVRETGGGDVQLIGLVPNIAHTVYTVHVKSKGIKCINTFRVDCDLVARRLVLKNDDKPELYSVQSLKRVNLSPKAQS
ncbi:unnamed protein product, partial [Symbiodinium sp. CCMP2456]